MTELIILAVVFWLGYQVGQVVLSWKLRDIIRKEAIKEGIMVDNDYRVVEVKNTSPTVCQLFVEKANNILYLYNRSDDTFVCQGTTLTELARLAKQYKNIKYAAVIDGEEVYAFVDGLVKPAEEVLK